MNVVAFISSSIADSREITFLFLHRSQDKYLLEFDESCGFSTNLASLLREFQYRVPNMIKETVHAQNHLHGREEALSHFKIRRGQLSQP